MTIEQRFSPVLELRETDTGHEADLRIVTYGVRDSYGTSWNPAVFKRSIDEGPISAVFAHESNRPIGVVTDFRDDGKHLDGRLEFLDFDAVPDARMAYTAMKQKAYRGVSFGFERRVEEDDKEIRDTIRIMDADLIEISPVLRAAVPGSKVLAVRDDPVYELRSVNGATEDPMEILALLDKAVATGDVRSIEQHLHTLEELVGMTPTFSLEQRNEPDSEFVDVMTRLDSLVLPKAYALSNRADSKKPYGDVKYADPKNGKYPIDTEAHVKAAWSYINQEKNAAKYPLNGVTLSEVKSRIKAACKKFGIDINE